jgi:hypothetical protein
MYEALISHTRSNHHPPPPLLLTKSKDIPEDLFTLPSVSLLQTGPNVIFHVDMHVVKNTTKQGKNAH